MLKNKDINNNDTSQSEPTEGVLNLISGKIHIGKKDGTTGCGFNTSKFEDHWERIYSGCTCNKNGCIN